jgi:hypothetical protein
VELLETREAPSASPWLTQSFDTTPVGSLPAGWAGWSNTGSGAFQVSTTHALSGNRGLTSGATTTSTDARAWFTTVTPADVDASATVYVNSLIPTRVLVRGSGLSTTTPSFYAVAVTRGLQVQLLRVTAGVTTVLGRVSSQSYFSNGWVQVTVEIDGSTLQARVYRPDQGRYLNSSGQWSATATWALRVTDTAITHAGLAGVERPASYGGAVSLDNFSVTSLNATPPPPPGPSSASVSETFDTTPVGRLPAGWAGWSNTSTGAFQVSTAHALGGSHGLTSSATTTSAAARAWYATATPADIQASAAVYLDSIQPARILVRGSALATTTPTYYAVAVTRGLRVQLLRVVHGATTVLATLTSPSYFSGHWVQVTLYANGGNLRVQLYRPDQGLYLDPGGQWVSAATWAVNLTDTGITRGGFVGVERPALYPGAVGLDNFSAIAAGGDSRPPAVTITSPAANATLRGVVTVRATVTDNVAVTKVEFYVDGVLRQTTTAAPYTWLFDTSTAANGTHTLTVLAYDPSGNVGRASVTVMTKNDTALSMPAIVQHLPSIRIAELAYTGTPLDAATLQILRNYVDLVIADPTLLAPIHAASPSTARLIYTNFSNLYGGSLLDWLAYADANRLSRESAFYHVTGATPFSGSSSSSVPVNWFWDVERTAGPTWTNRTSQANGTTPGGVAFAAAGGAVYVGYPELFREIDLSLASGAGAGWSAVLEYPTAVDAAGTPTAWGTVSPLTNTTAGWTRSGQITFDPPPGWLPAVLQPGGQRLYYVRIRTLTAGTAPVANTILGMDYVHASGGTSGVIPAFNSSADAGNKGYLTVAEYARRAPGDNAWFAYQSRLFYPSYGQMRFVTNPSNLAFDNWAVSYAQRVLKSQPLAEGFFVDNSGGNPPVTPGTVLEATASYATDYAAMLNKAARAVGPGWLLANTVGTGTVAAAVVSKVQGWYDEFGIRALASTWQQFEDLAGTIAASLAARSPSPFAVLDGYPAPGFGMSDPRLEMATLAEYYLMADPHSTFLDFFGGFQPSGPWVNHWVAAAAYNIGRPTASWSVFATGADPSNSALTYKVYERPYGNGLVLYKPLSSGNGQTGTTADNTATTMRLPGGYRVLGADGTLGPVVTSVTLRNGEGVVLVRASG